MRTHMKVLTRCLIHHLWVFSSGYWEQQESSPPAHQTPPRPSPFLRSLWKKKKTTDSNKHKSYQMRMSPGSSSDGGRLWEQEGRVLLDSWLSSLMVSGSERFVSIWSAHWLWQKDFPLFLFSHQHWWLKQVSLWRKGETDIAFRICFSHFNWCHTGAMPPDSMKSLLNYTRTSQNQDSCQ